MLFHFTVLFFTIFSCLGAEQNNAGVDPYVKTNYEGAFHPGVLRSFFDVLEFDGSLDHIPEDFRQGYKRGSAHLTHESYETRRKMMVDHIQYSLLRHKNIAVWGPLFESSARALLCFTFLFYGLEWILNGNDYAKGFGGLMFMESFSSTFKELFKAIYIYSHPTNDPYERWEKMFAKKMPYVPYKLWGKIVDTFGAARLGRIDYSRATEFFDIAFNLPSCHRFPYRSPLQAEDISRKGDVICRFTDSFFADYQNGTDASFSLKSAIRKYLRKIAKDEAGFVCVHIEGPGGMGKSFFVRKLAQVISDEIGEIPLEEVCLRGDDLVSLEGDERNPGLLLSALSRISKKGVSYGLLVFEEASWLNGPLKETSKRIFEPNLGSFKSRYLDGIDFSLQGFLVFFISNAPIEDEALRSRMIHVMFPTLKKESLRSKALDDDFLRKYCEGTSLDLMEVQKDQEIARAIEASLTMRDIDIFFPIAIERILDRKRK